MGMIIFDKTGATIELVANDMMREKHERLMSALIQGFHFELPVQFEPKQYQGLLGLLNYTPPTEDEVVRAFTFWQLPCGTQVGRRIPGSIVYIKPEITETEAY